MNILLQAAPQGGNNFLLLILMFVAMFAFMIFPSMRRQRQEKKFYEGLKSGLHGRITEISDTSVVIETLSGKLKFERSAVSMEYSRRISQTENK